MFLLRWRSRGGRGWDDTDLFSSRRGREFSPTNASAEGSGRPTKCVEVVLVTDVNAED